MSASSTARVKAPLHRSATGTWGCIGLLVATVLVAYHNTFSVPFLLDDTFSISDNESIRHLGKWWAVLAPRAEVYTSGRPLLNLSFALNFAVGELSVRGYHVVNLLIHLAAAVTLFALVRRTAERWEAAHPSPNSSHQPLYLAAIASLFWALHPVQTNCVTYISQRAESLMGLCYLLTLYAFIRDAEKPSGWWRGLSVMCCLAGMMAKEAMVTAPLVVLLFDRTFVTGSFRQAWRERRLFYLSLSACWLALFALMFGTRVAARGVGFDSAYRWTDYAQIETGALLHYLRLVGWPFPLVFDYGQDIAIPGVLAVIGNAFVLGILVALTWVALRRRSPLGFLSACFFILLSPTSTVVPVYGQPIGENRLYLPLAVGGVLFALISCRIGRNRQLGLAGGVMLGFIALTVARNRTYATELAIAADTVARSPGSSRAHANYAVALSHAQRLDDAIAEAKASLGIDPNYPYAHTLLGAAYYEQQRFDEAISHFSSAAKLQPANPMTHSNLGASLFRVGRAEEALAQFQEAIRLRPTHQGARDNAAILLARLGRPAEAIALFEETLHFYPNDELARTEVTKLKAAVASGTFQAAPVPRAP